MRARLLRNDGRADIVSAYFQFYIAHSPDVKRSPFLNVFICFLQSGRATAGFPNGCAALIRVRGIRGFHGAA